MPLDFLTLCYLCEVIDKVSCSDVQCTCCFGLCHAFEQSSALSSVARPIQCKWSKSQYCWCGTGSNQNSGKATHTITAANSQAAG